MIGHSWPEYVFIRAAILALRLIAPLSVIYLAASYHAGAFLFSPFLGIYALVEAAFFLLVYWPRSFYLQRVRFPQSPLETQTLIITNIRMPSTRRACLAPSVRRSSTNVPIR